MITLEYTLTSQGESIATFLTFEKFVSDILLRKGFFVLLDFIRLKNWMKRTKGRFCVFYSVTWLCFPWHCLQGSRILLRFPVWWRQGSRKPRRPIAVDIMCPLAAAEVGRAAEEPARARALQNCDYLCYNLCSLFGVFFTRKQ